MTGAPNDDSFSAGPRFQERSAKDRQAKLNELAKRVNAESDLFIISMRTTLHHAVQAGEMLAEAKALAGPNQWSAWLKKSCPGVHERTASNWMRIASHRNLISDLGTVREALDAIRDISGSSAAPKEKAPKKTAAATETYVRTINGQAVEVTEPISAEPQTGPKLATVDGQAVETAAVAIPAPAAGALVKAENWLVETITQVVRRFTYEYPDFCAERLQQKISAAVEALVERAHAVH